MCEQKTLIKFKAKNNSRFLNTRLYKLDSNDLRKNFQRDRDRIIHSRAFRRLQGKAQVFTPEKGDHYRNRLTHTLEVSQIGRTICRELYLNEDLVEAIALGHDLGHTPFGHSGERILHEIITNRIDDRIKSKLKGFKHNFQSLNVVDNLEMSGYENPGLNLTLAVREGIIKHTKKYVKINGIKEEVVYENLNLKNFHMDLEHSITLEGQIVSLSDEIAQSTHDLEDGIRANIINLENLIEIIKNKDKEILKNGNKSLDYRLYKEFSEGLRVLLQKMNFTMDAFEVRNKLIKGFINLFIMDAINNSKENMFEYDITYKSINYELFKEKLISNSKYVEEIRILLNNTILKYVISSQEISQFDSKAKYLIREIFKAYLNEPKQLPDYVLSRYFRMLGKKFNRNEIDNISSSMKSDDRFIRLICDHIAGMTDGYALKEYSKLYSPISNI